MICKACKVDLPEGKFGRYKTAKGTECRRKECTPCRGKRVTNTYRNRADVRLKMRGNHLIKKYGITLEDYDRLFQWQQGLCAICCQPFKGSAHVDHDHATGKVRGLLCFRCNSTIGKMLDSETLLKRAIDYIRSSYNNDIVYITKHITRKEIC